FVPEAPLSDGTFLLSDLLERVRATAGEEKSKEVCLLARKSAPNANPLSDLRSWDAYEPFVTAASALCGITVPEGQKFCCVLPGHAERHPSANLWRGEDGLVVYRDLHAAKHTAPGHNPLRALTLTEVFAAQRFGKVQRLRGMHHRIWKLRLLAET